MQPDLILPSWPAPACVRAAVGTRRGGVSPAPYDSLNLGLNSGDDPACVAENRARFVVAAGLPVEPNWLRQVHGTQTISAAQAARDNCADAVFSRTPGEPCAVLTADCLPVLLCSRDGKQVAAAHAGWRGLAAGILEATLAQFDAAPGEVLAWLGPAIGPQAFEVGAEVSAAFRATDAAAVEAFQPVSPLYEKGEVAEKYLCDLYHLARQRLARAGVSEVYGGGECTYNDSERFYSYRRDGVTGRMAAVIWIDS